jgi:hypothetical protein
MRAIGFVLALIAPPFIALALIGSAERATAQTQRLPRMSPAEQQFNDINRSLQGQQRRLHEQHQTQVEINQLRQELNRQQNFPSMTGPGGLRGCPPGSIGC